MGYGRLNRIAKNKMPKIFLCALAAWASEIKNMTRLNQNERDELNALLAAGNPLPKKWMHRLFPNGRQGEPVGKEYRLVYDGKLSREEVLVQTPAAPWQHVRSFCTERPHEDGWRNLLVWGDNLMALRELLADQQGANRFGTKGKIKLIYIDPPFATKQDFMKDKEKAYRDKVLGAQFIEFLRRRLIMLRELLAPDGSIYVHLDSKKVHYLKAVMDEIFGEENFINEVVWRRRGGILAQSKQYGANTDSILFYAKSDSFYFKPPTEKRGAESYVEERFKYTDEAGRRYRLSPIVSPSYSANLVYDYKGYKPPANGWSCSRSTMERWENEGKLVFPKKATQRIQRKQYLDEWEGRPIQELWDDIPPINPQALERIDYPTQKPERLVERVIRASSARGDIVLDCFSGSGTTAAVAEKLGRRWIAMDCGKLAIYTTQKRLFSLASSILSPKENLSEPERVEDWAEHLKSVPGMLFITEKARKGECNVTLDLLHDLAALAVKYDLVIKGAALSILCPEDKLRIPEDQMEEPDDGPGSKRIVITLKDCKKVTAQVEFRLSIIAPKDKAEKEHPLPAKEFALFRAGVYDMDAIKSLPWPGYRPFVLKLFGVREHSHARYGFYLDGYIGTNSAVLWNYPDNPNLTLDYGYVDDLHRTLRGKAGERFYVIAPVIAMAFAEDEVKRGETTYVFLKVPLSVLLRLIERKEPAALRQPAKEEDVNEVIDAVGFDFISQPQVEWTAKKRSRKEGLFTQTDYVLEISEFCAQTLATDPEDFKNFETFSMAMVDTNYNGDVFQLSRVFWGDDLVARAGGIEKVGKIEVKIGEDEFTGKQMMVVLCDRYGNEKSLLLKKNDFRGKSVGIERKAMAKRATEKRTPVKQAINKSRKSK
jgi:hypothetical protein